jgi:hypothetical protein
MTEYTIQYHTGDKVLLEYDHALHSYVVDEDKVPNVTTIIDSIFPKYLSEWAARCGADYWKTHSDETENMYHGIINAHKDVSGEARDIGHETHYWIEDYINKSIKHPDEGEWKLNTLSGKAKTNGKFCIVDFKTSAKIYKEAYVQLSAYAEAIEEIQGKPVELAVILRLDKDEEKYQEAAFKPSELFEIFLMAMRIKKFQSTRIKKEKL